MYVCVFKCFEQTYIILLNVEATPSVETSNFKGNTRYLKTQT